MTKIIVLRIRPQVLALDRKSLRQTLTCPSRRVAGLTFFFETQPRLTRIDLPPVSSRTNGVTTLKPIVSGLPNKPPPVSSPSGTMKDLKSESSLDQSYGRFNFILAPSKKVSQLWGLYYKTLRIPFLRKRRKIKECSTVNIFLHKLLTTFGRK